MKIKFEGEIETEVELPVVFKAFKQFMTENLQNYKFSMSGDKETIRDKQDKPKVETPKEEEYVKIANARIKPFKEQTKLNTSALSERK